MGPASIASNRLVLRSTDYLAGDVDGRLEATAKSLSRQDAFVLTDPHNHDDVAVRRCVAWLNRMRCWLDFFSTSVLTCVLLVYDVICCSM